MYFRTSSESEILPSLASSTIDAAANCFEVEPISKTVVGVIGTPRFKSAMP